MQGTKYLLRNKNISNANNFTSISNGDKGECQKDIGELTTLYRRNRGIEAVVAGGGIILSWTPLYKSEGPTQVALIMIRFLQLFFKGKSTKEFENFFLSYDNICHLDELKLLRDKLALEPPFDIVWNKINKIIDPLHLRNHTRNKCKSYYNPAKDRKLFLEANLICAEQTFTWLSRYKKIFNSISKIHFYFMLHRIIKARNRYTEYCYKTGRKSLLPSAILIRNV